MNDIEKHLQSLGITLPEAAKPVANYVPFAVSGGLVYIAGQLPMKDGKPAYTGAVGNAIPLEEGAAAARLCAINVLAQLRAACGGDLSRVKRIVKLTGFVYCGPYFFDIPKVINGASDLMVEVFGEAGKHARSALGVSALPLGASVEVEAIVELA
jgi:enamine deaminase RidA (YjgF/YER057c/UK114 family)